MDNKDLNQTVSETVNTSETSASETLETLNRLHAESGSPQLAGINPIHIINGVLCFLAAVSFIVKGIRNLISFYQWLSSWYATFSGAAPQALLFIGNLAAAAGFAMIGYLLVTKKKNDQLTKVAPFLVLALPTATILSDLIMLISGGSAVFLFWIVFEIAYAAFWLGIVMLIFGKKPELTKKISLAYIMIPSLLLVLHLLIGTSMYGFNPLASSLLEYAAMIMLGVIIYMELNKLGYASGKTPAEKQAANAYSTAGTQNTYSAPAPEPEGYLSIVRLIVLSIVTLGIYVYIWIYHTALFTEKRSPQGPQSSAGIQVVLCLFVPFYFIYWVYKQCKAIEDIRLRTARTGSEDLSLICLLLSIFGFGIVAYALMQDQINKVVKPSPTPAYDFYPHPSPEETYQAPAQETVQEKEEPAAETPAAETEPAASDAAASTDAQIETVKKLKALLDAGILTEEEFNAKKKQVLGL